MIDFTIIVCAGLGLLNIFYSLILMVPIHRYEKEILSSIIGGIYAGTCAVLLLLHVI